MPENGKAVPSVLRMDIIFLFYFEIPNGSCWSFSASFCFATTWRWYSAATGCRICARETRTVASIWPLTAWYSTTKATARTCEASPSPSSPWETLSSNNPSLEQITLREKSLHNQTETLKEKYVSPSLLRFIACIYFSFLLCHRFRSNSSCISNPEEPSISARPCWKPRKWLRGIFKATSHLHTRRPADHGTLLHRRPTPLSPEVIWGGCRPPTYLPISQHVGHPI